MDIKEKINSLPQLPGAYIFKGKQGNILYIGKAGNLRKRVQSYFTRFLSDKNQAMVSQIQDMEYIVTASEAQAQLTEAALIKQYKPKYNVSLRDDKSFPLICITKEEFPRIFICRSPVRKGKISNGVYFGPYTNAKLLRQALKIIRRIFGFCSCRICPPKPCMYYRLKLCPGPCFGKISAEKYRENISNIILFLEGKQDVLLKKLFKKMEEFSARKEYEQAAVVRNQIEALSFVQRKDAAIDFPSAGEELKAKLKLMSLPVRIEAFDISNIFGREACGSMVSFLKGAPDKNNYRRFRIREVGGIDDYAMLAEVVRRRYSRLKRENLPLPDLVIIDGGKQHLLTAKKELDKLKVKIPVISIAKEKENIYLIGKKEPINLSPDSAGLHLIQRLRNEAHRFAVSYHHVLRRKKVIEK